MKKLLTIAAVITFSLAVILLLALFFYSKQQVDDVLPTELDVGFIIALLIAMSAAFAAIAPLYNHMQNKQKRKPQITETEPKTPNYTPPATSDSFLQNVKTACELKYKTSQIEPRRQQNFPHLHIQTTEYGILNTAIVAIIDYGIDESSLGFLIDQIQTQYRQAEPAMPVEIVYGGNHAEDKLKQIAINHRIKLIHISQYKGLLDFSQYSNKQQTRLESSTIYPPKLYVDQRLKYGNTKDKESTYDTDNALQIISDWLKQDRGQFLLILGEFGTGKTFLLRELARRFHHNQQHIIPILLEMRSLEKTADLNKLLAQQLAADMPFDGDKFRYMLNQGQIILFFDGFDELALRVTYSTALEHFDTLLQATRSEKAKVVVTSRTQHFINKQQVRLKLMEHVESVKSHQITELLGFNKAQILQYLENHLGDKTKAQQRFNTIDRIKDLMGLSENPRMLSFIVRLSEAQLEQAKDAKGEITAADLYQIILDDWLNLEQKRVHTGRKDDLQLDHRWQAITELAIRLWERTEKTIHLDSLSEHIAETLNHLSLDCDTTTQQIGSGTLLVRDEESRFGFIHQSVMEWLLAKHIADTFTNHNADELNRLLSLQAISALMADFLCDLLGHEALANWSNHHDSGTHETLEKNARTFLKRLDIREHVGVDYSNQDLQGEDFSGQNLSYANFSNAQLQNAIFDHAILTAANFTTANCQNASFKNSQCEHTNFTQANLTSSNFNDAELQDAVFDNANLQSASLLGVPTNDKLWKASDLSLLKHFAHPPTLVTQSRYLGSANGKLSSQHQLAISGLAIAFHPSLPIVATSSGASISLWHTVSGDCLNTLNGHRDYVRSVAFSPDGLTLASGSNNEIKLWNAHSGDCLNTLNGHQDWVQSVAFSPDGSTLASGSNDEIKLWNAHSGDCLNTLNGHQDDVISVAFSPDGSTLASGSNNEIKLWNVHSGDCLNTLDGHKDWVQSVAFSPDGLTLASGSNNEIKLWNARSGDCLNTSNGHEDWVRSIAFNPDGSTLASGLYNEIKLWNAHSGGYLNTLNGHKRIVNSVAFSPDGSILASGANNEIKLWNAHNGDCLNTLNGHKDWVRSVAFSPNGSTLASGSNNEIKLWNAYNGDCLNTLNGHKKIVNSVAFSPDGSTLASGSFMEIKLWNAHSGDCLNTLNGHQGRVNSVAFSPDGSTLASGSFDHTLKLWNAHSGDCLNTLNGHQGRVNNVAFSPDGSILASGSFDHTLKLWNAHSGDCLKTLNGHKDDVSSVAFSPDGLRLASSSGDGSIRLWRVSDGVCIAILVAFEQGWVAYTPDGRYKYGGNLQGNFWHSINLCRFEVGELDPYWHECLRLRDDEPLFTL